MREKELFSRTQLKKIFQEEKAITCGRVTDCSSKMRNRIDL